MLLAELDKANSQMPGHGPGHVLRQRHDRPAFSSVLMRCKVVVMSGCLWTEPYGGPGILALASILLWGFES